MTHLYLYKWAYRFWSFRMWMSIGLYCWRDASSE